MKVDYLTGVNVTPSELPGIYVLGNGNDTWYAASYNTVKSDNSMKEEIVEMTNQLTGRSTTLRQWEWHHVVETQHMSNILSSSVYQTEWYDMPTILINRKEHQFFSRNFNNNDFRELATIGRGRVSPLSPGDRDRKLKIIDNLNRMYSYAYIGYPNLGQIAKNVFDYHRFH